MAAAASKRKRDSQDLPGMRPAPAMHGDNHDFTQNYINNDDDGLGNNDNNIDFSAMLQGADGGEPVDEQQQQSRSQHAEANPNAHAHQGSAPNGDHHASDTAAAAMAQYHHTMTVPQSTEQAFMRDVPGDNAGGRSIEAGHGDAQQSTSFPEYDPNAPKDESHEQHNGEISPSGGLRGTPGGSKPAVGSDEWHKQRKDNHKEVERRRRETINEGINELSKIVPGCEKNKGQILSRAVSFITQLKDNETQNIEKWTLEKLLAEQAIAELSASCDRLKHDAQRAQAEGEAWKRAAQRAGVTSVENFSGEEKSGALAE